MRKSVTFSHWSSPFCVYCVFPPFSLHSSPIFPCLSVWNDTQNFVHFLLLYLPAKNHCQILSYLCFFWSSRYLSPEHELWLFIRISSSISYFISKAVSIKKQKQLCIPKLQGKAVSMQQHTTAPTEGKRYVPEEILCSTQTFITFSSWSWTPFGHECKNLADSTSELSKLFEAKNLTNPSLFPIHKLFLSSAFYKIVLLVINSL